MLDYDPNYFQFTGPIFFIGPFPRPENLLDFVVQVAVGNETAALRSVPGIFSDLDLAQRCIAYLEKQRPEKAGKLKPFATGGLREFASALEHLLALGHAEIAIDALSTHCKVVPTTRLIDAIRQKLGGNR